jgi:hypothetical protein
VEGSDNVTKVFRSHNFETGVQVDYLNGNISQPPQGRGNFTFNGQYTDIPNSNQNLNGIPNKSIFTGDVQDIVNLIQNTQTTNGTVQFNGNTAFVNYAPDAIGYLSNGQYTNAYTVIVSPSGDLVTAFPGFPGR